MRHADQIKMNNHLHKYINGIWNSKYIYISKEQSCYFVPIHYTNQNRHWYIVLQLILSILELDGMPNQNDDVPDACNIHGPYVLFIGSGTCWIHLARANLIKKQDYGNRGKRIHGTCEPSSKFIQTCCITCRNFVCAYNRSSEIFA